MSTKRGCPNCGGAEWFEGAACWDCGWEAKPDAQGHTWSEPWEGRSQHERLGLPTPVCLQCGIMQRADKGNSKCRGKVRVGLWEVGR